eukprot:COSAG01_NODE_5486_length_4230_cov_2.267974_3_plen_84_part_00
MGCLDDRVLSTAAKGSRHRSARYPHSRQGRRQGGRPRCHSSSERGNWPQLYSIDLFVKTHYIGTILSLQCAPVERGWPALCPI